MTREEIIERAIKGVTRGKKYCDDIEFSPEDAARTERDFLCMVVEAAIKAGATTVNIPDTVGYATPQEYGSVIALLKNRVPNIDQAVISTHCHNDLGLAVANSLAACRGRRAADRMHHQRHRRAGGQLLARRNRDGAARRGTITTRSARASTPPRSIPPAAWSVDLTGLVVQRNKAIVGENAFAHESGIHQDGVLKYRETYEIMDPTDVGIPKTDWCWASTPAGMPSKIA